MISSEQPVVSSSAVSRDSDLILRIALLTPYSGNNLGDAAIVDSLIANLQARFRRVEFSGITLDSDNFLARHGARAMDLYASGGAKDRTSGAAVTVQPTGMRHLIGRIPVIGPILLRLIKGTRVLRREFRHGCAGRRFLCDHDLVIVAGGGQLDDEWGGSWGHPYSLFKWGLLARIAGVPFAVASVGAGKIRTGKSRWFLRQALRLARHRTYRDANSAVIAKALLPSAAQDSVVPDLAFSMPASSRPEPAGIRSAAQGRTIVAVSPIVYARPASWSNSDPALYHRYLAELANAVSILARRGCFVVLVRSAGSDQVAIEELLDCLDSDAKEALGEQIVVPPIASWQDLVAILQDVDFIIASRLHSVILSFVSNIPTIAISFDPKVDWVMSDLKQSSYVLQIHNFTAPELIDAFERLERDAKSVQTQIESFKLQAEKPSSSQYDALANLALTHSRTH